MSCDHEAILLTNRHNLSDHVVSNFKTVASIFTNWILIICFLLCKIQQGHARDEKCSQLLPLAGVGFRPALVRQAQPWKGHVQDGKSLLKWDNDINKCIVLSSLYQLQCCPSICMHVQLLFSYLFSMSNQSSDDHTTLAMPENWELYKEVIKELYIKQGYTLEQLIRQMSTDHGINAS